MNLTRRCWALALWTMALLLTGCGGGASVSGNDLSGQVHISGQVQKGPFGIGSDVAVNELDDSLNPTGKVYTVQISDYLGHFAVASTIGTNLVEIVGNGFYMDELTGQLSTTAISLRAIADLSVNAKPTINILTSLQKQRLMALLSQGKTYAVADAQSQAEVLAVFGIDSTKINLLTTLYSMQIDGSTDADAVLLATSVILSKMATNAALANGTTQSAELSNYINTIAAQITNTGTITTPAITTAINLAAIQIDPAVVRSNLETYYAARGVIVVAPKFEEWLDQQGTGVLPNRITSLPKRKYVIGSSSSGGLTVFSSNATTGALTSIGSVAGAAPGFGSVTADPTGKYVYARDWDLKVSFYSLNATTGALTLIGSVPSSDGIYIPPVIDPSGKFAYVVSQYSDVSVYTIDASTGALTYKALVLTSDLIGSMAIDPTGKFAYVTHDGPMVPMNPCAMPDPAMCPMVPGSVVSAYAIDAATGALTPVGTVAAAMPAYGPGNVLADPSGKFVYVAVGNNILAYIIDTTTGALTLVDTEASMMAGYTSPSSMAVDPTGKFVYVASNDNLSAYNYDASTGALTLSDTAPCTNVSAISIDPSGKFIYLSVGGSSVFPVFTYTIDAATGKLTRIGQVDSDDMFYSLTVIAPQ